MSELRSESPLGERAAAGLRFSVVVSRFNATITEALAAGAIETLQRHGAADDDVCVVHVPGAYELPMAAHREASSGAVDAVVCVGALIRGETPHFDVLAQSTAIAIQDSVRATGVPITFGVLTCDTMQQAAARAGGNRGNKGAEAAVAAVEMAVLFAEGVGD